MKLSELYESSDTKADSISIYDYAEHMGYSKASGTKKINGERFKVILLKKEADFGDLTLEFEYIINPETEAWTFEVSKPNEDGFEFGSGEDDSTLIKHLKKKQKLTDNNLQKYFK